MALQNIQNIINYDPEELERKLKIAQNLYETDSSLLKINTSLKKARMKSDFIYGLCLGYLFVNLASILAIFWASGFHLSIIVPAVLALATLKYSKFLYQSKEIPTLSFEKTVIYFTYFTPKLRYHQQVFQHKVLTCCGKPLNDTKFELDVVTEATDEDKEKQTFGLDGNTVKQTYTFDYDGNNPDGILTLDVGNGRVFYS